MKYLSTTQVAKLWGISARRVAILCEQNRIKGVQKAENNRIIPETAKTVDARVKSGRYIKSGEDKRSTP